MERPSVSEAARILGLAGAVDAGQIKRAYRELAREHHPDRGGDARIFQQVQAAYDVLRERSSAAGAAVRRPDQPPAASVGDRWWESSTRWHEAPVDTSIVDWGTDVPAEPPYSLSLDRLAVALMGEGSPVAPVVAHSRSPGSWLHRVIGWLQPDLLAELRIGPAEDRGIRGHDVHVRLTFRSLKARRMVNDASLPQGWIQHRGSSTTTIQRVLHPSPSRQATAARVAAVVDELTAACAWPLDDWYVTRGTSGGARPQPTGR